MTLKQKARCCLEQLLQSGERYIRVYANEIAPHDLLSLRPRFSEQALRMGLKGKISVSFEGGYLAIWNMDLLRAKMWEDIKRGMETGRQEPIAS